MRDENPKKSKVSEKKKKKKLYQLSGFFSFTLFSNGLLIWFIVVWLICEKLSWSKTLVKKWFNIKSKGQDFHADDVLGRGKNSYFLL